MTLKINMQLYRFADEPDAVEQGEFARWLLEVGEARPSSKNKRRHY
jgi:hypothetical protein